ncbi:MAG: DUF1501 domain-containing protein [Verrucomicrobia bacterium]|nr:MAG: DUF1501 domain-containing protein [Verrucomicrobiota bacterium]
MSTDPLALASGSIGGLSRRRMLARCSTGFGLVALSGLQRSLAAAAAAGPVDPFAPRPSHHRAKAKSVIFCFMSGGVSHVDTFDPKPRLKRDHGKPMPVAVRPTMFNQNGNIMASPWEFSRHGRCGLPVSELFPHIGACADDLAVIRSMTSIGNEHAQANYFLHTGFSLAGFPSAGAWTTYGLGSECRNLPGFVVLSSGGIPLGGLNIYGNGFLPAVHQASLVDPTQKEPLSNIVPHDADPLQRKRLGFVERLDRRHLERLHGDDPIESAIRNYEVAYRMQTAVPELVDLRGETEATRKLYGLDSPVRETAEYGRQCLLARRLVERGVRFVELTCLPRPSDPGQIGNPWDQHGTLKAGHAEMARQVDQPIAGLLRDLKSRGMLDDTLVVWAGEFGRTPFAQASDGRDHNPFGFSVWLAGGGIRGGTVVGATDELGYHAVEDVCTVYDLWATVLHCLGMDHERLVYRHGGRDFRLTDVHGNVIRQVLA